MGRKLIKRILRESFDFDWVEKHEYNQDEVIQHIKDNNITEWTFGEEWKGGLDLRGTKIQSLGNLESVGGYLNLQGTKIQSLGNLESVGGGLNLYGTKIQSLGNLESVGGGLELGETPIQSLGNLKSVGIGLYLKGTPIQSLGNLKSVGVGGLDLNGTPIQSLGNLESVDGNLDLRKTPISKKYSEQEIREMVSVGRRIYLSNMNIRKIMKEEINDFGWTVTIEPEYHWDKDKYYVLDIRGLAGIKLRETIDDIWDFAYNMGYDTEIGISYDQADYIYFEPTDEVPKGYMLDWSDDKTTDPTFGGKYQMLSLEEFYHMAYGDEPLNE